MTTTLPPTIDPTAARRLSERVPAQSPWLHEEVARRMEERLQWIVKKPAHWLHWDPLNGGRSAQTLLAQRYPKSRCHLWEATDLQRQVARDHWESRWWQAAHWTGPEISFDLPAEPVEMLWANMALHLDANPQALIAQWHTLLAVDGFLMFSCLGPDTLRELRGLYQKAGWPFPHHEFTDMHDWGDMLVGAGFAEPVMDMERITLSYSSPEKLLQELRELGRNLHVQRFPGLRGRGWLQSLRARMAQELQSPAAPGRLEVSFEIIYGHAFKPAPKIRVTGDSRITLDDMRHTLGLGKTPQRR